MTTHTKRPIKPYERLAILPEAVQGGPHRAQWWDSYVTVPYNAMVGTVAVVSIRGALDHHPGWGCDSYDAILRRTAMAFAGENDRPMWMLDESERAATKTATKPSAVVLRIDSPGGVVSGLNQCVFALRKMAAAAGIPLIAYADELAASAAYALACACEDIVAPPSAILGSIGVISTLYDQVAADEKMGLNVVTLTSGARKSDGHPHVAISKGAIDAEQARVDKMALQFFRIVAEARGLPVADIRRFEAGIFLGSEAVKAGVADATMSFDALVQLLNSDTYKQNSIADRSKSRSTSNAKAESTDMSKIAITNQIARAEAALKKEKDPTKRKALAKAIDASRVALAALSASTSAMKKTKIKYEESSEEETAEEEEAASEEEEEEAGGNETDRKETSDDGDDDDKDDDKDDDEDDEDDEDEDEEESKKASAALHLIERTTGRKGSAAIAAMESRLARLEQVDQRLAVVEKDRAKEAKAHRISAALASREISPHEAKTLRAKSSSYVKEYIADRKGKRVVMGDDDETVIRPASSGANMDKLPPEAEEAIRQGLSALGALSKEERAKVEADLRTAHLKAHKERMMAGLNGAAGRV
jgi:signal peptide peptidase SppA